MKFSKATAFFAGIMIAALSIAGGAQVHAGLQDATNVSAGTGRLNDLQLVRDPSPKDLKGLTPQEISEGLFVVGPDGRAQYLGPRADLDKILNKLKPTQSAELIKKQGQYETAPGQSDPSGDSQPAIIPPGGDKRELQKFEAPRPPLNSPPGGP